MAKGNMFDKVRNLRDKSARAAKDAEKSGSKGGDYLHPASSKSEYRKKPKSTSMAPDAKNKRKSYGRAVPETAAEERKRKGK